MPIIFLEEASERRCFIGEESINISSFREFCNTKFGLRERANKLTDSRQKPQITTGQIYQGVLLGGIFRKKSFLQIDQFLRGKEVRKFIGSKRTQVASDSALLRVLDGLRLTQLRNLNYLIYSRAKQNGLLRLKDPLFANLRIGVIDGSCLGGIFWATCFELLGDPPIMLDFEPMANKGKELPTARKLFHRLEKRFGKKFVDLVLMDGLYVSQHHINQCLRAGIDVLIKTDETTLNIIEDAEGIFNQWEEAKDGVSYEKGIDEERLVEYEIWRASGFSLAGVTNLFQVARVKERDLKTGEETTFWVLTTRLSLSNTQIRELAHRRWSIENNGFKQLNNQVESKRIWTHDEDVWLRLFWIQIMAFNLIGLFTVFLEKQGVKVGRLTREYLCCLLLYSLIRELAQEETIFN